MDAKLQTATSSYTTQRKELKISKNDVIVKEKFG